MNSISLNQVIAKREFLQKQNNKNMYNIQLKVRKINLSGSTFNWLLVVILFAFSNHIYSDEKREFPLDIRNNYAPTFLYLDPQAVSPTTLSKGKSSLSTNFSQSSDIKDSNLYVNQPVPFYLQRLLLKDYFQKRYPEEWQAYLASDIYRFGRLETQNRVNIDLEASYFYMRYNYGLTDKIEAGIQISAISYNSGIMDSFINSYHTAIGVKTGKELVPNNKYSYNISDTTGNPISTPPRTGLGDTVLSTKWNLKKSTENGFSYALVALLKVPTGNLRYEMGSGRVDGSIGLAVKYKYNRWIGYLNLYGVGVSNPFLNSDLSLRSFVSTTVTLEYQISKALSVLAQVDGKSSAYRSYSFFLSRPQVMGSLGLNWNVRETSVLQFSFTEDITISVPDITGQVGWKEYF